MNFKKGQQVHHIGPWDDKACVVVTKVTVAACGKKQMLLVNDANEKFMGRSFLPTETQRTFFVGTVPTVVESVFAGLTDAQAEAKALEMAQAFKAHKLLAHNRRIEMTTDCAFIRSIQNEIAAVEASAPSFCWR